MQYKVYMRSQKAENSFHQVNEDSHARMKIKCMSDGNMELCAIADGMTGLPNGALASHTAVETYMSCMCTELVKRYVAIKGNYSLYCHAEVVEQMMQRALKEANQQVCNIGDKFHPGGTTISAATIMGDLAVIINTGDSPVYYYQRAQEKLSLASRIMNRAEAEVIQGKYKRESEEYYRNSNILLSYLGKKERLSDSEIYTHYLYRISSGDKLILGTDGVFGNVSQEDIHNIMGNYKGELLMAKLFEAAKDTSDDDQSAILYEF